MTPQSKLEEIYARLEARNIGGKNGVSKNLVPGVGLVPAKIMFIAEAPGAEEDKHRIPLIGPSGKAFDELLELSGLKRSEVFVTNAFKYRTPGNRDPNQEELVSSVKCLSEEINLVSPSLIVPMGRIAISMFYPGSYVKDVRGKFKPSASGKRTIFCTYHPATLIYGGKGETKIKSDFGMKIKGWIAEMT